MAIALTTKATAVTPTASSRPTEAPAAEDRARVDVRLELLVDDIWDLELILIEPSAEHLDVISL